VKKLVCLACLTLAACTSNNPDQPYKFTYNPPDSVSFVVDLAMSQTYAQGDQQNVDSTWTRTRHVQRAVPGGFEVAGKTDSVAVFRNGQILNDPIVGLFAGGNIVLQIDTAGVATGVLGFDELMNRLDSLVGPDTAAMVRQVVTVDALKEQEMTAWNGKFTPFVGREMKLGSPYCDTTFPVLPVEGRLASYRISEIVDTVAMGSQLCARVSVTTSTDPAELAKLSGKSEADIEKLFGLTRDAFTQAAQRKAGYSSTREWVVEFKTMLSHSESSRQDYFFFDLSQSGMPVKNRMAEAQSKLFSYPEGSGS
jgi:hypothetical protein